MLSVRDEVRAHLERLVAKRQGLDEAVAEFSTRSPEGEYKAAATELSLLGRRAQAALLYALEDSEVAIRVEALLALGRIGSQKAAVAAMRCLDDGNADVRWAAVETLGAIGDAAAVVAIARLLRDDSDLQVRAAAARALGVIARRTGTDVASYLTEALADPNLWVQQNARNALELLSKGFR